MDAQHYLQQILTELTTTTGQVSAATCAEIVEAVSGGDRLFLAGAGRSGLAVRAFAMRLMHLGFITHVVGEVTTPSITASDVLIIGSGSGSTGSLVTMAQKAHRMGAKIILITIVPTSPIGQLADIVLRIPAPSSKVEAAQPIQSIQPMGTLFEQTMSLTFDTLILLLMQRLNTDSDTMFTRHANLE